MSEEDLKDVSPDTDEDSGSETEDTEAEEESSTSKESVEENENDEGEEKEDVIPKSRFNKVYRKMRDYEESAKLVDDLQKATGMSREAIRTKLYTMQQPQGQAQQGASYVDAEARRLALQASRDSQIARLLREEPDATELIESIEDDFMDASGKKSVRDIYEKYKQAIAIGRSSKAKKRLKKEASQVESGSRTSSDEPSGMTSEKFNRMSLADKEKYLRKQGVFPQ